MNTQSITGRHQSEYGRAFFHSQWLNRTPGQTHQLQGTWHLLKQHRPNKSLRWQDLCYVLSDMTVMSHMRLTSMWHSETEELSFKFYSHLITLKTHSDSWLLYQMMWSRVPWDGHHLSCVARSGKERKTKILGLSGGWLEHDLVIISGRSDMEEEMSGHVGEMPWLPQSLQCWLGAEAPVDLQAFKNGYSCCIHLDFYIWGKWHGDGSGIEGTEESQGGVQHGGSGD